MAGTEEYVILWHWRNDAGHVYFGGRMEKGKKPRFAPFRRRGRKHGGSARGAQPQWTPLRLRPAQMPPLSSPPPRSMQCPLVDVTVTGPA